MFSFVERCAVGHATGLSLRIVVAGDLTLIFDGSLHENQQGNNNTQAAVASGSGGPSAEPAPETEVKGSGERPLAEAAALEIDPERLQRFEPMQEMC